MNSGGIMRTMGGMRMAVAAFLALTMIGAACRHGSAFPARGPESDIDYFEVTCASSAQCWAAVHDTCPARYRIDERDGQQVTTAAVVNGTGGASSHKEQTWLFHCTGSASSK